MIGMRPFMVAMAGILIGIPGLGYLLARDLGVITRASVVDFAFIVVPVLLVGLVVMVLERSGADLLGDADDEQERRDERRVRAELRPARDVFAVPVGDREPSA